ncbi:unnamed protein product [Blepharisma stoltei]|uniref:Uncharacterized protein n=1 Tax=Blepharisma stoltei TaxID=1481888 RepID=A0AAU9J8E2_9CILI|nr:unnamed protein product [Blepharisma stoltei]
MQSIERLNASDSGNASTEDLLIINNIATSLDATQMPIIIRVPRGRSFFEESSSEDVSERLIRTFNQDVMIIDETLESLLEKSFSENSREDPASFLADLNSQSWKYPTIDDNNNSCSFNDTFSNNKKKNYIETLREEVYFEQPFTLITLGDNELFLHDMVNDRENNINFPENIELDAVCVLPDGQIIATCKGSLPSFRYQASNGWNYIGELIHARSGHFMVFHKGTVYVIGGTFQGKLRREVEKLNPNDCWEEIAPLNNPRMHSSAASMQGKLYVTGGICEIENYASIEVLSGKIWSILDVKIPNNLYGHACFFTPEHKLVILGGMIENNPARSISIITEGEGVVVDSLSCEDYFPLNSWSYFEEEGKIIIWGSKALWKFDISTLTLYLHKTWPVIKD